MLFTIAFIVIAVAAVLAWLFTLEGSARRGYHEAKVDELDLSDAARQYTRARMDWLSGAHDPALGATQRRDLLERAVFLQDRVDQLQGRAHGSSMRKQHRQALSSEAARSVRPLQAKQQTHTDHSFAAPVTPAPTTDLAAPAEQESACNLNLPAALQPENHEELPSSSERYFVALRSFEVRHAAVKAEAEALEKPLNVLEGLLPILRAQIRSDYRLGGRSDAPHIAGQVARLAVLSDQVDALHQRPHGRGNRVEYYGRTMAELFANGPDFGVDDLLHNPGSTDVLMSPPPETPAPVEPPVLPFDAWREQFRQAAEELLMALPDGKDASCETEPADLGPLRQAFGAGLDPAQQGRVFAMRQVHKKYAPT